MSPGDHHVGADQIADEQLEVVPARPVQGRGVEETTDGERTDQVPNTKNVNW